MSTAPPNLPKPWSSRRLVVVVAALFGVFVLFDIALFGWLIFESLSQRELEEVLLETREEAAPLAERILAQADEIGDDDLFVVISVAQENLTYLGTELTRKDIVSTWEVRNKDGEVVFKQESQESLPVDGVMPPEDDVPRVETGELDRNPELRPAQGFSDTGYETEIPIGDLGSLVIGLSPHELERRIGVLRRDLIRQVSLIGVVTLLVFGLASAALLRLSWRAERLERQAAEAERMAMIGRLASGLAHEIRNPLNSLNLNMQMLEEDVDGAPQKRLLGITRSELGRLENLVTDFLSYAKPRPLELVEIAPGELFERVLEVLSGEIRSRRVEVEIFDASEGALLRVDRDQIGQLLLNLTQNALAAVADSPRSPRIVFAARWLGEPPEGSLALEITDNGRGIPEDEQEKVFELFFSTRKGGTGLGLPIVRRIARSHGGEVEVDSIPGEGTTMRLILSPIPRRRIHRGS